VSFSLTEAKIAINFERSLKAHYLAESGIEIALEILLERDLSYRGAFTGELETGIFVVEVSHFPGDREADVIRVDSLGIVGNTVEKITLEFQGDSSRQPGALPLLKETVRWY